MKSVILLLIISIVFSHNLRPETISSNQELHNFNMDDISAIIRENADMLYMKKFSDFLASEEFNELIEVKMKYAGVNGFHEKLYIAGYIRGFLIAARRERMLGISEAQGEGDYLNKDILMNHEMFGFYEGRNDGGEIGLNIWNDVRSAMYVEIRKHRPGMNDHLIDE